MGDKREAAQLQITRYELPGYSLAEGHESIRGAGVLRKGTTSIVPKGGPPSLFHGLEPLEARDEEKPRTPLAVFPEVAQPCFCSSSAHRAYSLSTLFRVSSICAHVS